MTSRMRFRQILPAAQVACAALFGGWGLWQRDQISQSRLLVRNWVEHYGQIPRVAMALQVRSDIQLSGAICRTALTVPIGALRPTLAEAIQLLPTLIFVLFLWGWVGSRLDQRWTVTDRTPWIAILLFTIVSLMGAFLPTGYPGFLPYGFLVWIIASLALARSTTRQFHSRRI
jgi:hypothetical protein